MFIEIVRLRKSTLLDKFKHIIDTEFPYLRNAKLWLAISGGKDSMTLSNLLLQSGIQHSLLHCNFQLRGDESEEDEKFLRNYAAKNNLVLHVKRFDTYQISQEQKLTIQECARKLRYEWFKSFLEEENSLLLTAHHRDDSIETFFINLFRGTGFRGLAGIPVSENKIIRPLSGFTSEDIYHYIDAHHIDYRADSSNAKRDYLRNKIRLDLIPALIDLDPDFQTKMGDVFTELNQLKKLVDQQVRLFNSKHLNADGKTFRYVISALQDVDDFLLLQIFRDYGIYQKNVAALKNFLNAKTGAQFHSDTFSFLKDREEIIISSKTEKSEKIAIQIAEIPFELVTKESTITFSETGDTNLNKKNKNLQQVDFDKLSFPLTVRNWQEGDKIKPLGMSGTKLISDILIDKKINRVDKENILVLLDATNSLIALIGLSIHDDYKIETTTKSVLEILLN